MEIDVQYKTNQVPTTTSSVEYKTNQVSITTSSVEYKKNQVSITIQVMLSKLVHVHVLVLGFCFNETLMYSVR